MKFVLAVQAAEEAAGRWVQLPRQCFRVVQKAGILGHFLPPYSVTLPLITVGVVAVAVVVAVVYMKDGGDGMRSATGRPVHHREDHP